MAAINWIKWDRKEVTPWLTCCSISPPDSGLDGIGKGPWRGAEPSEQSIIWGNVKGSCITTENENSVCQVSLIWCGWLVTKKRVGEDYSEGRDADEKKELDNAIFITEKSHTDTAGFYSSADAHGDTIILIHYTVYAITTSCSVHQGFVSSPIPDMWHKRERRRREQKKDNKMLTHAVSWINYSHGWKKTKGNSTWSQKAKVLCIDSQ